MKVLIVDFSIPIVERLEEMLSQTIHIVTVHRAISYEQAIILFQENKPDVVLLDGCLPGNNSFKILREMKKPGCRTSVIILATNIDNYTREHCKTLGADFFFDKYSEFEKIPVAIDAIACTK